MTKAETAFRRRVMGFLETEFPSGWWRGTTGTAFASGFLDIIGCYYGTCIAIELKCGQEKPTKLQESTIQDIMAADGIALWVSSREDWRTKIFLAMCGARRKP